MIGRLVRDTEVPEHLLRRGEPGSCDSQNRSENKVAVVGVGSQLKRYVQIMNDRRAALVKESS